MRFSGRRFAMKRRWKSNTLALVPVLVLAAAVPLACTPEDRREAEAGAEEAGRDLEAAGRAAGEELSEAGEAVERGLERANRQLEPYARDVEITAKVKTKLAADPEINPFRIDVDTVNGRVTLSGTVRTERQREEAETLARGTEGVSEVRNLLEVGPRGG
jgi:hyperosmotically inducible protein